MDYEEIRTFWIWIFQIVDKMNIMISVILILNKERT